MSKKENKKEEQKQIVFTLDTETRGLFGEIFRVGLYGDGKYFVGNKFDDIKSILFRYAEEYEVHIYIHNLEFDLSKLAKDLLPIANFDKSLFINNHATVFQTYKNIILHDSLKLLPGSLESLSRDFELDDNESKIDLTDHILNNGYAVNKKGEKIKNRSEFDLLKSKENYFNTVDPFEKVLNDYLRADCISLYKIIMYVYELSGLELDQFLRCPTTASLAMKVYQNEFKEDYQKATHALDDRDYDKKEVMRFVENKFRCAYYGGRTEVFIPTMKNGYHFDINSMYPAAMKFNKYPVGFYSVYNGIKAKASYRAWKHHHRGLGFVYAHVHVPEDMKIPPLPVHYEHKLMFPAGNLKGYWTFNEVEMAEKYGCEVLDVEQVVYFKETANIFQGYVEKFEKMKKKSTGSKRFFSKLCLNSLYGKFGMVRERDLVLNDTPENREKLDQKYEEKYQKDIEKARNDYEKRLIELRHDKLKSYTSFIHAPTGVKFLMATNEVEARYIQVHLAAYVTSYARIMLYEAMQDMLSKGYNVYYCDTDSMAVDGMLSPEFVDDSDFGKWKLEGLIEKGIFIQPKLYAERETDGHITKKAKGVTKATVNEISFEFYEEILEAIKNGEDKIKMQDEIVSRYKLLSSLKENREIEKKAVVTKFINLRAKQKRDIDYINNTSRPHVIYMFGKEYEQQLREEAEKEMLREYKELKGIEEVLQEHGYIKIPQEGDYYYHEYKELSRSAKRKFFRKKGMPIDQWFENTYFRDIGDMLDIIEASS